jgi:hypothetical protein
MIASYSHYLTRSHTHRTRILKILIVAGFAIGSAMLFLSRAATENMA